MRIANRNFFIINRPYSYEVEYLAFDNRNRTGNIYIFSNQPWTYGAGMGATISHVKCYRPNSAWGGLFGTSNSTYRLRLYVKNSTNGEAGWDWQNSAGGANYYLRYNATKTTVEVRRASTTSNTALILQDGVQKLTRTYFNVPTQYQQRLGLIQYTTDALICRIYRMFTTNPQLEITTDAIPVISKGKCELYDKITHKILQRTGALPTIPGPKI